MLRTQTLYSRPSSPLSPSLSLFPLFFSTSLPPCFWFHLAAYEVSGGPGKMSVFILRLHFSRQSHKHIFCGNEVNLRILKQWGKQILCWILRMFVSGIPAWMYFYIFWNWHLKYTLEKTRLCSVWVFCFRGRGKESSKNVCFSSNVTKASKAWPLRTWGLCGLFWGLLLIGNTSLGAENIWATCSSPIFLVLGRHC